MQQRLSALQQQQDQLQAQLSALPAEQQQLAQLHQQHLRQQHQQQQHPPDSRRGSRSRGGGRRGIASGSARSRPQSAAAAAPGVAQQQLPAGSMHDAADPAAAAAADGLGLSLALVETERDRLIRCGLLTPFDKLDGFDMRVQNTQAPADSAPQQLQQAAAAGPASAGPVAGNQQQLQQHQAPAQRSSSAQPRGSSVVDEQWALLMRNAVPATAAAAAAGGVDVPPELADVAHHIGRAGLPLSDLLAKAAQQAVEVGVTNRPRAILLEAGEVSSWCGASLGLCLGFT